MKKERSNSMMTTINVISSIGVLCVNLAISFFLSPYIIRTIGVEANGFANLANNFVSYANLIVTALNAMAARYITIAYVKKDYKKANLYYNSVFWGNLIIVIALLLPATYLVLKLERFVDIPLSLQLDVKILFAVIFLAFFVRTGAPNYDCGTYVTNRMDLSYIPGMIMALVRCILIYCMFSILQPRIWYVGFTSTFIALITLAIAGYYTHKLTPELKISFVPFVCSFKVIFELVGSGIWSSIAIAGNTLMSGLDLLVCNVFLGSTLMGILSLSKTLPNILITLSESIRGAFGPELTINFANGDKDAILNCIKKSMKIASVIVTIPTAGLVVMSDAFYHLWVPSQDARLLQILTVLAIGSYLLNSGVIVLLNVFTTVNKVRYNSIAMIVSGFISIGLTILCIKFTEYDIYAVAGISSIVAIAKNMLFTVPVASKLLGYKWYQFYPQVGISAFCSLSIIVIGSIFRMFMPVDTWLTFIITSALVGIIGLLVNMQVVLSADEREYLVGKVKSRIIKVR